MSLLHVLGVLGLVLIPLVLVRMVVSIVQSSRREGRYLKLRDTGTPEQGVVVHLEHGDGWGDSYAKSIKIQVRVEPENQEPYEAVAIQMVRDLDVPRIQPGSRVEVRVDPRDHSRAYVVL